MEASRAFEKGTPILSDEQYDDLKKQLRRDRSTVVAQVGCGDWCSGCGEDVCGHRTALPTLHLGLLLSPLSVLVVPAGSALQHQEQVDVLGSDGGLPEGHAAERARCAAGVQHCWTASRSQPVCTISCRLHIGETACSRLGANTIGCRPYIHTSTDPSQRTAASVDLCFTQVLGLLFSIDDITGFEITKVIELPKPYGIVFVWGLVLPSLFILANAITSLVFKDALILKVRGPGSSRCFAAHAA